MKVSIIGNGQWGNALAALIERAGHKVDQKYDFKDSDLWVVAVPARYFRTAVRKARRFYYGQPVIVGTKGIEPRTHKFMSEILDEELPESKGKTGVLSGPQFAGEVVKGVPTGSTLAGPLRVRKIGRKVFAEFYLEETTDIVGAEICGIGKNAVALGAGFYSVKKGENEKAMMVARAWGEVADIGVKIGAKLRTFIGLCGTGDLFLSTTSSTSRNFSAGAAIALKKPFSGTIESFAAVRGLSQRAKKIGVKTPVLDMFAKLVPK